MGGREGILAVFGLVALAAGAALAGYEDGMRAAQNGDYAAALREWQPLADQNHPRALTDLGFMYANGHGVPRDEAKAVELYRRAAELGLPLAQFNLGYTYLHGQGVARDPAEGLRWYERAAKQGFVAAQFNLGVRYYTGEGVERDLGEAYVWFALAERGGHARAERAREGLAKRMTPADLARLDIHVAAWEAQPERAPLPKVAAAPKRAPLPPRAEPKPEPAALPPPAAPPRAEPKPTPAVAAPRQPDTEASPAKRLPVDSPGAVPAGTAIASIARPVAEPTLVQLGSLTTRASAEQEWQRLLRKNRELLGKLELRVQEARVPGRGTRYRVRAGPLQSFAAAEALCAELGTRRVPCLVVDPAEASGN